MIFECDKMSITAQAKQQAEGQATIKLLNKRATYPEALELARRMNSRLPTLKEFIISLKDNPKLYRQSKGDWYWLGDEPGISIPGHYKINYEKGTIEKVYESQWLALPLEERAYAWKGDGPLALFVYNDSPVRRLVVAAAYYWPGGAARVALVPQVSPKEAAQQAVRKE